MQETYLGKDIWYYSGFGSSYYFKTEFGNFLNGHRRRNYVLATANNYQKGFWPFLKKAGFKNIATFRSAHGGEQTLTLWFKTDLKAPKVAGRKTTFPLNCSITPKELDQPNYGGYKPQCSIKTGKNYRNYFRVANTSLFIKFRPESLIKYDEEILKRVETKKNVA